MMLLLAMGSGRYSRPKGTCTPWKKYLHTLFINPENRFVFLIFFNSLRKVCAECTCRAHTHGNMQLPTMTENPHPINQTNYLPNLSNQGIVQVATTHTAETLPCIEAKQ